MIALLPGRGRRRITRAGETARANQLQAELDKATEFIDQLCAINREVIAERDLAQSQARQYLCAADDIGDDLIRAEIRVHELEAERAAAWAQRDVETTLTIPAPADADARLGHGDGLCDTDEEWVTERTGRTRRARHAQPDEWSKVAPAPAPADGDGLSRTDEEWREGRTVRIRPAPQAGPVVQVLHVKNSPDPATALPAALDRAERTAPPVRAR